MKPLKILASIIRNLLWYVFTFVADVYCVGTNSITKNANAYEDEGWPRVKTPFDEREIQSPTNVDTSNAEANYDMPGITFHRTADLIHQHVEIENTGYYCKFCTLLRVRHHNYTGWSRNMFTVSHKRLR